MTNEERELIAGFMARVGGAPQGGGSFLSRGVPATQPALPALDPEADQFIGQQFQQYPEAKYRITQTALVQEAALAEAQNRIQRLQWELEQARGMLQQAGQPAAESQSGAQQGQKPGFFGSLFGGGGQQQGGMRQGPQGGPWGQSGGGQSGGVQPGGGQGYGGPPPQPQYPPNYQPGMFQQRGSGFLGSALTTAAGVAGGMVVGNALMGAFGGNHGGASASPWGADASSPGSLFDGSGVDPVDTTAGFADPFAGGGDAKDTGLDTPSAWDGGGGNFDNCGSDGGGGFDSGGFDSGGFDDNT